MADDQQNPFTMMGMMQMMQPNKYIDPAYANKPLPIPGYIGTPTDAQGNPIKSYTDAQAAHDAWQSPAAAPASGMTLNSTPGGATGGPYGSPYDQRMQAMGVTPGAGGYAQDPARQAQINPGPSAYYAPGNSGSPSQYGQTPMVPYAQPSGVALSGAGGPAAPAAAPSNPIDMRQAYLTALSNPGKVTTPGANVPQAQPLGQPSVLNSFLAANPGGGGAGAGNYNNQGFFSTLNKLRAS